MLSKIASVIFTFWDLAVKFFSKVCSGLFNLLLLLLHYVFIDIFYLNYSLMHMNMRYR